jgi:hypothetical protein
MKKAKQSGKKPLLSIFVPTYNRPAYLRSLLCELDNQIGNCLLEDYVEVIVSDNSDEGPLTSLWSEFSCLTQYFHHERNIGADNNFLLASEVCNGQFVWTIGDDDSPDQRAVSKLVTLLKQVESDENISLIKLSSVSIDESGEILVGRETRYHPPAEVSGEKALELIGDDLLRMSTSVFRTSNLRNVSISARLDGSLVSPLAAALECLGPSNRVIVSPIKVLCTDGNKEGWVRQWGGIVNFWIPWLVQIQGRKFRYTAKSWRPRLFPKGMTIDDIYMIHHYMGPRQRAIFLTRVVLEARFWRAFALRLMGMS